MEPIKNYFKNWGITRIIRLVLAGALGIAFYYNRENIFLFVGIILAAQAIFNISCPGGSCETGNKSNKTTEIDFEKYEPKK
ncbi:MAG: hypothetical protein P4L34_12770 [Paludibacter sp.]|nr:hypothetical protein [Paludibacter sp.]